MGKVTRVGGRGTSKRVTEKESDDWSGKEYQDIQKKRKEAAKDTYVTMGRGTRKVKFSDIAETKGTAAGDSKGHWVRTNRGTSRRWVPGK
jgi:hypothetical protein